MAMVDQLDVRKNRLTNKELNRIVGGFSFTGSIVSALHEVYKTLYGYGVSFGKTIRRFRKYRKCKI